MRKTKLLQRDERGVVDVVELAHSVHCPGAVQLAGFVQIAEKPNEKLIDPRPGRVIAEPAADSHRWRSFRTQVDFAIVRDVLVPFPGSDSRILTGEQPAPRLALAKILHVHDQIDLVL